MKKNCSPGLPPHVPSVANRHFYKSPISRASHSILDFLPALTVVIVLSTLVLYLTVDQNSVTATRLPDNTVYQAAGSSTTGVLAYAEADYQDFLLSRSRSYSEIQTWSTTEPTAAAPSDLLAADPALTSEPLAVLDPAPTTVPEPTPVPRVFDAGGIPQEALPVSEFTTDSTLFYVKVNQANIRELPTTAAPVVTTATMGDKLTRLGFGLDWSSIQTADGQTGYMLTSLITTEAIAKPTPSPTPKPTPSPIPKPTPSPTPKPTAKPTPRPTAVPVPVTGAAAGSLTNAQEQAIVDLAKSCLGIRYVYGCESPSTGFDCSGLTTYIYKTLFNITLPRSARSQSSFGTGVSRANIAIGDIICFDWDGGDGFCDHVGIYIGGGEYIHATHSGGNVVQSTLKSTNPVVSIRRIIK